MPKFYRIEVLNDRKKFHGSPSDIVRHGQVYPAQATVRVDVSEKQLAQVKVRKCLVILKQEEIAEIENPIPEVIRRAPLTEKEKDSIPETGTDKKGSGRGKSSTR